MTDQEKIAYAKQLARPLVIEFFRLLASEAKAHGPAVSDQVLYTFVGSIISTQLLATIEASKSEVKAMDNYINEKRCVEATIAQAFQQCFERINPGTTPEFQCDITMLDDGKDDGKSN
jgi:hypothetical protein